MSSRSTTSSSDGSSARRIPAGFLTIPPVGIARDAGSSPPPHTADCYSLRLVQSLPPAPNRQDTESGDRPVVAPALRHRFVFIINRYINPPLFFVSLLRIEPRLRPTGTAGTNLLFAGNDRGTIYATGLRTFILIARNHEQDRRIVGRQGRIPALPHLQNHRQKYVAPSLPSYRRGGMGSLRPQYPDVEQPATSAGARPAGRHGLRFDPARRPGHRTHRRRVVRPQSDLLRSRKYRPAGDRRRLQRRSLDAGRAGSRRPPLCPQDSVRRKNQPQRTVDLPQQLRSGIVRFGRTSVGNGCRRRGRHDLFRIGRKPPSAHGDRGRL